MQEEYSNAELRNLEELHLIHNYAPFDPFFVRASGCKIWDSQGREYIDMLSCYSALNLGHGHPRILKALLEQSTKIAVLPGCFRSPERALLAKELADFCGMEMVAFKSTGLEAVETAIKIARKWAYTRNDHPIPQNEAEIIVCKNNFHGRSTTIVSFSTESQYRDMFGPHTPGFKIISYGDTEALKSAITSNTAAFLVEPIQGEGGIVVPPEGYLKECFRICRDNNVLFIADEIQTGFGRTGKMFACEYENIKPDLYILAKSLGGGFTPISAVVGPRNIIGIFEPGDDGSTFGGNPLACHVAREALRVLKAENLDQRAYELGRYFRERLAGLRDHLIKRIRGRGLLIGIELGIGYNNGHELCEELIENGVLCKETRKNIIRLAPPLTITKEEIDWGLEKIEKVFCNQKE